MVTEPSPAKPGTLPVRQVRHVRPVRPLGASLASAVACLLLFSLGSARAQFTAPAQQDPLMSLLLAQPKMDFAAPVHASASFDPPVVRPGEVSIYRVTFNALEESIEWPAEIKGDPGLETHPSAQGQMLQMAGPYMEPRTTYNAHARAAQPGEYNIPEFVIRVYGHPVTIPAARLQVATELPPGTPPSQHLFLSLASTNLMVGQPVKARILLPSASNGMVQGLTQPQLNGDGFLVDQGGVQQHIEALPRNGVNVPTYIYETTLTPIQSGKLSVFAQGFTAGNRFSGPIVIQGSSMTIPGGPPQYLLLESDPLNLEVRPLPREGELPGFTGGIGNFTNDPPRLSTNLVRVGDPLKLSVTIRGEGNLMRLVAPPPPVSSDWQIFASTSAAIPPQVIQAQGYVTFEYTLLPRTESPKATPAIPFATYDPKRGGYVNLTIPPVPIMITPGETPSDVAVLRQADAIAAPAEPEPALSGLAAAPGLTAGSLRPVQEQAWFPVLQLCPGFAFLGLWGWDRRRRYLELHPEIMLRRRARRALRRERRILGHAARAGDASRFADAAVTAMRIACAPHYPAEQRALVGGDVLQVLGEPGGPNGVVRKFFAVTDAATYAGAPADTKELLALEPELHQVLEQLDARLCV